MSSCAIGGISIGNPRSPRSKRDGVSGMLPKFLAPSGYRSSWIWLCSAFDRTARLLPHRLDWLRTCLRQGQGCSAECEELLLVRQRAEVLPSG